MPLEFMGRAPYAPASVIVSIIAQHRKTPISKFDPLVLDRQVGVSESLVPRTLAALQLLGFSDEENNATPEFGALARVSETELKPAVADILRTAYEPVIANLGGDPSTASPEEVATAFRSYNPLGQIDRMVQLFTGLMAYVGMMPEQRRRRRNTGNVGNAARVPKNGNVKPREERDTPTVRPLAVTALVRTEKPLFSRMVNLGNDAGTITLSGDLNPFVLTGEARKFFYQLIDLIDEYRPDEEAP